MLNRIWLLRTWIWMGTALLAASPAAAQVVVADAGDDLHLECTGLGAASATLDGLGSTVDGASAALDANTSFSWTAAGIPFVDPTSPTPTANFPLGTTTVTLTVAHTDPTTLAVVSSQDTVDVTVADTTPPTLSLIPSPAVLWPPNHKLRPIELTVVATDACDPSPVFALESVTSSEPDNGTGDGDTTGDIQGVQPGTDDRSSSLRSERAGNGGGRVYTVIGSVTDASANATDGTAQIVVPHDMGDAKSNKAAKAAKAAADAAKKAAQDAQKAAQKAAEDASKAAKAAKGKK